MDKAQVTKVLREISLLLQMKGESAFKSRAYDVAADRVAALTEDLGELVRNKKLTELPGIGDSIAAKISTLVSTGRLDYHDELRGEYPAGIFELLKVPDLGPKKAHALWKSLGVGDVASLEAACKAGKVRALKGFGAKSEEKLLASLEVFSRTKSLRRPLGEVLPLAEALLAEVSKAPGVLRAALGGSVRRFCETVADVDIIASAEDAPPVLQALTRHPRVATVLGQGESKASVRLAPDDLQVDLRVLPDVDFATALHHFTGSKAHHIRLRGLAAERGLKISEWGVHRVDGEREVEKLVVPDEAALYRLLKMQYVPPELREDWGEVEHALAGTLPEDLVTEEDLRGNVHAHSTWSDGKNSLEELAKAAQALGLEYLTVTEHSRSAGYAGGLKADDLDRQSDEIDALNDRLRGFRLLKGVESDILEDGSLDYPDQVLERLDVVIGSIHQRHAQNEDQMTRRLLAALDNPNLHIVGHLTGRLLQQREPSPMRVDEVLDKAARAGVAFEVNGQPERMDLKAEHVRKALERGVKLVLSTDAHSVAELSWHRRFAVATARKGWARKSDVLNTLPAKAFCAMLRRMRSGSRLGAE